MAERPYTVAEVADLPERLDVNQAARYLGVSRSTVYREIKDKRIWRIVKVRGSTFISRVELDRYLTARAA